VPERRPSPETQVGASLARAKRAALPFAAAWERATKGEVCDTYRSARTDKNGQPWPDVEPGPPPNLRVSSNGQTRCAGCRFRTGSTCALYGAPIYPGVLWPHRTDDRREWQAAIAETVDGWRDAYEHRASAAGGALDMLARREETEEDESAPRRADRTRGAHGSRTLAA
jgi:hypothetical protein